MAAALAPSRYDVVTIARTGAGFAGFGPYVPSISEQGEVAFFAELAGGGTGVFCGNGGDLRTLFEAGSAARVSSHPDLCANGAVCFYAEDGGDVGMYVAHAGSTRRIATRAGPLGPSASGNALAWRAEHEGAPALYAGTLDESPVRIAEAGPTSGYESFHGIPVITPAGSVCFRATTRAGDHEISLWSAPNGIATIASTAHGFSRLGNFPSINDRGEIAFAAARAKNGGDASVTEVEGIFAGHAGRLEPVLENDGQNGLAFESFRGALVDNAGRVVFFATPRGGSLGIYCGPDAAIHRVLGVGDSLLGASVREFALNPVSINAEGQLAVRVGLTNGEGVIVRADRRPGDRSPQSRAERLASTDGARENPA